MDESHRCDWGFWPTSLDEKWTCPDCGVVWSAFDGRTLIDCAPECSAHHHIGWTSTRGGRNGR